MLTKAYINDAWRLATKLTFRKVWNWLLIFTSFQLSRWTGRAIHWGQPASLSIEPTTACNLRCPECPSGLRSFTRPTGNLKSDFFRDTIQQTANHLVNLTFYFQGEPYINPGFLEMVKHAHDNKIYTTTSTNGHFLDEKNCIETIKSGLDRMIISIDGTTQETYSQYRKEGNLQTVLDGAKTMVRLKKEMKVHHPYIIFQFLVVRPNEHQIEDVKSLAHEIGVDEVKFKTAQLYDYENGHPLMPKTEKYSRYKKTENGRFAPKNALTNECWKLWHSGVITWNGLFVPCCFDKDARHIFGDLKAHNVNEVWNGKTASSFRKSIMKGRQNIDICTNCSEGCKIWA